MSLSEAQNLYDLDGPATEVVMSLQQIGQEPAVMQRAQASAARLRDGFLGNQLPRAAGRPLTRKGGVMDIFSVIILVIAGIGILNLLLMAVYERTREIGLLGALGLEAAPDLDRCSCWKAP